MVLELVTWLLVAAAFVIADLRWLRVAQREHYEPLRVIRLAGLWTTRRPVNALLIGLAVVALIAGIFAGWASLVGLALLICWPLGLGFRGRTSKLAWTPRLRRVAIALGLIEVVLVGVLALAGVGFAALAVALSPLLADLALAATRPIETRLSSRFVERAKTQITRLRPRVVGITGSYGKTSTKLYVQQLLSGSFATVVSPASFNNLLGLSRAVNERLVPGTDVFVAEMGTYGPGEIRQLCSVFPPEVAAITTIGEAHLERMGSRAAIAAAKAEITEQARVVVLNVDIPELRDLAETLPHRRVIRCSTDPAATAAQVIVSATADGRWQVVVAGEPVADLVAPPAGFAGNLAIAVGVALALEVPATSLAARLTGLPTAPHRSETVQRADGVWVIDDTYNSNPIGAARALAAGRSLVGPGGRVYVITPGMIELGSEQAQRNTEYARSVLAEADSTLVVIGLTNRKCLELGGSGAAGTLRWFPHRQAAVEALSPTYGPGDVVIYENDLPDHYP